FVVENCAEGGQNMGFNDDRDYLVWNNINFPSTGTYLVEYRVASGGGGGTVSCDLDNGGTQLGNTTVPGTGGWQNWQTVSRTVNISAGPHNFGIYSQVGGWNLNWVRISRAANRAALATAGSTENDAQLSLYPNPVADELHLSLAPALADRPYRLVNTVGQVVGHGALGRTLDVRKLPAGLYLLQVTTQDQQTLSRRIVVAH
ncbi:MAG: carbohydrate-binding protein, partial [Hymenobacter sp.]|nr:carbohydrate-binding protein [Hymenobacter sp.]